MIAGLARIWYGFLGLVALGHGGYKQQGSFTDFPDLVSPATSLTVMRLCRAAGVESLSRVNLIWNYLLNCLTEGKNFLFALLIVVPCEIKWRIACRRRQMF